jgi:hypothetical protein
MTQSMPPFEVITKVQRSGLKQREIFHPNCQRLRLDESLPSRAELKKGKRVFYIPTENAGDERLTWDARFLDQIQGAKKDFDDLVARGMVPFRVDTNGKKTPEVMEEFDPNAEEVIFSPLQVPNMIVGG